jgi:ligand-binding SRPBCC domain-containing protein
MQIYICGNPIPLSAVEVMNQFNEKLFNALTPPFLSMKLVKFDGCKTGDRVVLKPKIGPFYLYWESLVTQHGISPNGAWFIDEGVVLPFFLKSWYHFHYIAQYPNGSSRIIDNIRFKFSSPFFLFLYPLLYLQFAYRIKAYDKYFKSLSVIA